MERAVQYEITIESNGLGILVTLSGNVRAEEIFELNQKIISDPSYRQWRYQIWSFADVQDVEASLDQLRNLAIQHSFAAEISPRQRIAIIPRKRLRLGIDTLFHALEQVWGGGYESKTFETIDSARAWVLSNPE